MGCLMVLAIASRSARAIVSDSNASKTSTPSLVTTTPLLKILPSLLIEYT